MTYNVGTYIDLTHLNRKAGATFQNIFESIEAEVGTSFTFTKEGRLARHIPVIAL